MGKTIQLGMPRKIEPLFTRVSAAKDGLLAAHKAESGSPNEVIGNEREVFIRNYLEAAYPTACLRSRESRPVSCEIGSRVAIYGHGRYEARSACSPHTLLAKLAIDRFGFFQRRVPDRSVSTRMKTTGIPSS